MSGAENTPRPTKRDFRRHFRGWELGLMAAGLAALSAWLAVPRPVMPELLPLPTLDRRELVEQARKEAERVNAARAASLPFEVRWVGELVRRYGRASAERDATRAARVSKELGMAVSRARTRHGAAPLLLLRAVQTAQFVEAAAAWPPAPGVDSQPAPDSLTDHWLELGGRFEADAKQRGWVGANGRLRLTQAELAALFRVRWSELLDLQKDPELRPTLADFRLYYSVHLRFPSGDSALLADAYRLQVVTALARRDAEYPVDYARGVLLSRMNQAASAAAAFASHLEHTPAGPWSLRARNHILALADPGAALGPDESYNGPLRSP